MLGISHEQWVEMAFTDYKELISEFIEKEIIPYSENINPIIQYEVEFLHMWANAQLDPGEHIACIIDIKTKKDELKHDMIVKIRKSLLDYAYSIFQENIPKYWKYPKYFGDSVPLRVYVHFNRF